MKVYFSFFLLITFFSAINYAHNLTQSQSYFSSSENILISKAQLSTYEFYKLKEQIKIEIFNSNKQIQMLSFTPDNKGCGVSVVYWTLAGALLGTVAALLTPNDPFWPPVSVGAGIGIIAWIVTCSSSGNK